MRDELRYAIERKAMEEALFVVNERAQVTLNCIGDAVVCTDITGNITFINIVGEKMTGWPSEEAAGRTMGEVFKILDAVTRETAPNLTVSSRISSRRMPPMPLVPPSGYPDTKHYAFFTFVGGTKATAASAVSSKNVNVSCRYSCTAASMWLE